MKKSTRNFINEKKNAKGYSILDLIHGYLYMRWPYFYISMGKGDHPLAKKKKSLLGFKEAVMQNLFLSHGRQKRSSNFADGYHGKVIPIETARQLVSINQEIRMENLEQVIPFEKARDIILKNPDHIVVIDCPCRKGMESPCLPMDVCLIIGEPFASFVLDHNPQSSRLISAEEARQILEAESRRGHVAHAFFKDAVLNRFYAICNCCSCCCGAMKAHRNGTPMIISSGYIANVDAQKCISCGDCISVCQFQALTMSDSVVCDPNLCMGCGVCVRHCEQLALSLVRDETKPAPLLVNSLDFNE